MSVRNTDATANQAPTAAADTGLPLERSKQGSVLWTVVTALCRGDQKTGMRKTRGLCSGRTQLQSRGGGGVQGSGKQGSAGQGVTDSDGRQPGPLHSGKGGVDIPA